MNFKQRLQQPQIVVAPGVYDPFTALLVEQAGMEACYLSGASIAYTRFGRPDIGFLSLDDVVSVTAHIRERVNLPLIVDADTGFGNALNVRRTVQHLERAGASAIQLEDQASPKRCGHLQGKSVISTQEMCGKIRAAVDARRNQDTVVIARTDAIASEGLDAAVERAARYAEAGADLLFVEAVRTREQMAVVKRELGHLCPLMANMVEGGITPITPADELQALGFSLVIFPGGTVRALAHTLQAYFASLRSHGTTAPWQGRMLGFDGLNALIGTPELLALGETYA
ncbi:oxaloacetate decarboxylase [Pantoea sp. 18069]|uniref:isocitrate lyase/PEP mutase family protein n=1 Tax=Pantoea sp. 18069 TaxID=2681415 RepID=UPI0013574EB9|nr:isocitrate lyase/PEP mutase family protein [Pantoea sp. 18069]